MIQASVYLDTSIVSAYCYNGNDAELVGRRRDTRDWWSGERRHYSIWASTVTEYELQQGVYPGQNNAVKMVRRMKFLALDRAVHHFARELLKRNVIPVTQGADALQLAVATINNLDYLLTWNYAHLSNPWTQRQLESLCSQLSLRSPILVTPENIPRANFGQTIRR